MIRTRSMFRGRRSGEGQIPSGAHFPQATRQRRAASARPAGITLPFELCRSRFDDDAVPEPKEETPLDRLWKEYALSFRDLDDLTLARWSSQTLSQLHGRAWRLSHPLVGALRLATQLAHDRQIWLKRLVNIPAGYLAAPCCRAPLLPLFTRDIADSGLLCQHCGDTAVPFDELPEALQPRVRDWAKAYHPVHDVAHWDEARRKRSKDYDGDYEDAAQKVERLLADAAQDLVPPLLEHYPAIIWEDQDECLEVRPEDIRL